MGIAFRNELVEQGLMLLYVTPLLFSGGLGLILALYLGRNRSAPGARVLAAILLGASFWSTGYALEFLSPGLETKIFWAKFQYLGITTIPLAWFVFASQYTQPPDWLLRSKNYLPFLAFIPLLTLLLVWTNEMHGLIWEQVQLRDMGPVEILHIDHGPGFWVYWVYSYCLLAAGTVRLVSGLSGTVRLHRTQIRLALLGAAIPWIGNLVYVTDLSPLPHLDWTPFAFTIAGFLFIISLFRFQLVNILPIAQRTVFTSLAESVLVLDLEDHIVDLNPAAHKLIRESAGVPVGKPIEQVLPELTSLIAQAGYRDEHQVEISLGEELNLRYYEMHTRPLCDPYPNPVGRLVVLYDITQLKQEQAQLEQVISERTEALRDTVEQLQHELTQRRMAERRFEDVVESAPDAMVLANQKGSIVLINTQAERLFGYDRQELLGKSIEFLIPRQLRSEIRSQFTQYTKNPSTKPLRPDQDLYALRKDGGEFPIEISLSNLKTEIGIWVAVIVRDITERRKAEQEQTFLLEQIQNSREELRTLTFYLQEVQEFERRQISTELHDRIGQNLTALNLNLNIIEDHLNPEPKEAVKSRLADSLRLVEETTRQVRDVMADLRPPVLDEYGLVAALQWYSAQFSKRTGIATQVIGIEFEPRLPSNDEMVLFRMVQEALNNAAKHAQASQVMITLESSQDSACLKVKDDGLGFIPGAEDPPEAQPHWGLMNMEQRAASIGGQLTINSAPGKGTQIMVSFQRSQDED